jgi:hypothetical protein
MMTTNTMRTMRTLLLVAAVAFFAARPAFSQDKIISGGAELAFLSSSIGFGLSGRIEAPINDKLNWTGTAGIIFGSGLTFVPLQGGVKYFFQDSDDNGAYLGGELGVHLNFASKGSTVDVVFSPGVGYRLDNFDFLFRYNVGSNNVGYSGIRAAYIFGN